MAKCESRGADVLCLLVTDMGKRTKPVCFMLLAFKKNGTIWICVPNMNMFASGICGVAVPGSFPPTLFSLQQPPSSKKWVLTTHYWPLSIFASAQLKDILSLALLALDHPRDSDDPLTERWSGPTFQGMAFCKKQL